ncbi:tRNA (adenine(22)-N(1))-methyltransferase [Paenibacillus sacheonensis]|uniref:tRNA (Adenine-N(1))-methyltransferase n=1 Tax=Paenibacillus sacheonensis TaxID=742054 RepID=A0A7X4YTH3_9BACL|nr:class I SAM-dependent methyltransferase [Paenibacillus sacheonensis]MBM7565665.1 tRNA (adenine22-N1)-methyltransferase [Paenibacillus sacheonensis]NBC72277.1 tRNA (adenine-N(1))-methyltransferase [Paenibacillus sacheonensis]
MIKLSKRLQTIADCVTAGARTADIGSDHALLPVYLLQSGKCPSAIAGELNYGPYQAARKQIAEAGLTKVIEARQGNGLGVLAPGEADTVTIAGMGGALMADILETGRLAGKLEGVKELVLQPNVGEEIVRKWLSKHGYVLQGETLLEEDGKQYEVLHALRAADSPADVTNERLYDPSFLPAAMEPGLKQEWLYRMGPYLLRQRAELLPNKWRHEIGKLERICKQMGQSELPESREKEALLRGEINAIEEVLSCLQMVKPSSNC